jgi:hypothetical protein
MALTVVVIVGHSRQLRASTDVQKLRHAPAGADLSLRMRVV